MMTLQEAHQIGREKLNIDKDLFKKAVSIAREMEVRNSDMGPMTLALAIMGVAKATTPEDISSEFTDALSLVSKAEKEWRMEQTVGRGEA